MNAKQLSAGLKAFGSLLGGSEEAALARFSQVFDGMGDTKATAIVTQIAKNWKTEGREAKRPAGLHSAVQHIHTVLLTMGATPQARVFDKVLQILTGSEHQDVESFVRDAIAARVKKTPSELAAELAQKLTTAASDRRRFDALLSNYEGRCKPGQLKAIAERFIGHPMVGKKSREDIVKAVRNWQREGELNRYSHTSQAKAAL